MKKLSLLAILLLLSVPLVTACSGTPAETTAPASPSAEVTEAAATPEATAEPTEEATAEPTAEPTPEPAKEAPEITFTSALTAPEGGSLYSVPAEEAMVFAVNNTIDGSVQMVSDATGFLMYEGTYTAAAAVNGEVKAVLTLPDGTTIERAKATDLGTEGAFVVLIKTPADLAAGKYELNLYIDGGLVDTATLER